MSARNRSPGVLATDQVIPTMRQHLLVVVLGSVLANGAWAGSWMFEPSTYSHDSQTGERVEQYARKPPVYGPSDPTYEQSAYIHKRTAIRGGRGNVDRRHYVETWGAGEAIRPYGEWQRPFRAGATPYGPWGNANGPWTTPFDSWNNPYGLGKLPTPPWSPWSPLYPGHGYPGAGGPPIAVPYGGQGSPGAHPGVGMPAGPGGMQGQAPAAPSGGQHGQSGQHAQQGQYGQQGHGQQGQYGQQGYAPHAGNYAAGPQSQHPGPGPTQ